MIFQHHLDVLLVVQSEIDLIVAGGPINLKIRQIIYHLAMVLSECMVDVLFPQIDLRLLKVKSLLFSCVRKDSIIRSTVDLSTSSLVALDLIVLANLTISYSELQLPYSTGSVCI